MGSASGSTGKQTARRALGRKDRKVAVSWEPRGDASSMKGHADRVGDTSWRDLGSGTTR